MAAVDLPPQSFQALRQRIRKALKADGVAAELGQAVTGLLADPGGFSVSDHDDGLVVPPAETELSDAMLCELGRIAVAAVRLEATLALVRVALYDDAEKLAALSHPNVSTGDPAKAGLSLQNVEMPRSAKGKGGLVPESLSPRGWCRSGGLCRPGRVGPGRARATA